MGGRCGFGRCGSGAARGVEKYGAVAANECHSADKRNAHEWIAAAAPFFPTRSARAQATRRRASALHGLLRDNVAVVDEVQIHGVVGGAGVVGRDGVGDPAVRADRLCDELPAGDVDKEGNGRLEDAHQAGDHEVSAALRDGVVERGVRGGVVVTRLGKALGLVAKLLDARDLLIGGFLSSMEETKSMLHLDVMTVTGKTLGDNLEDLKVNGYYEKCGRYLEKWGLKREDIIRPFDCEETPSTPSLPTRSSPATP